MANTTYFTRPHMKPLLEPYGLSEAARNGNILTIGGQTGLDAEHKLADGGLKAQAAQAFCNIREIVEYAGGDIANLMHLTWYLAPSERSLMDDALDVTMVRNEVLPGLSIPSTAVRVKELLTPEILVEIQAIAAL